MLQFLCHFSSCSSSDLSDTLHDPSNHPAILKMVPPEFANESGNPDQDLPDSPIPPPPELIGEEENFGDDFTDFDKPQVEHLN